MRKRSLSPNKMSRQKWRRNSAQQVCSLRVAINSYSVIKYKKLARAGRCSCQMGPDRLFRTSSIRPGGCRLITINKVLFGSTQVYNFAEAAVEMAVYMMVAKLLGH